MTKIVRIDWNQRYTLQFDNSMVMWNAIYTWAIERFGLPGDRFSCRANVKYLDYYFENQNDALVMALRWNARIVTEQELTVEFVGARL
jgi:hypothetical protein